MVHVNWILVAVILSALSAVLIFFSFFFRKNGSLTEQNSSELEDLFNKIVDQIHQNKYYLNKSLKLTDLATEVCDNERMVSRAINQYGNGNFNKFINSFRVAYSKEILINGKFDHYTIEAIAEEAGFSNKVSFYNAFKSETGMSPTQYRALKQPKTH